MTASTVVQDTLKLMLVQATLHWRSPRQNRQHLQELMAHAMDGHDILILPETFTTGFLGDPSDQSEGMDGETVAWMQQQAQQHQAVLCGSAVIHDPDARNRFLWVTPEGEVAYYDKRHLFKHAGEHKRYTAGHKRRVFHWRGWRICPQICYDIRFPVWCRNRDDYDLMLVVANWPTPRADAWSSLLKARAIENQAWVAAVNRVGEDGHGNGYPGSSVVHNALGAPALMMGDAQACGSAEISLVALQELRQSLPFQADADAFSLTP